MGKKQQDGLQRAKECYEDLHDQWADNRRRMLEDLEFSNPVEPQQWDKEALDARKGRPCLTLDRTNQYIVQVVNGGRMNKPGINCMPVDSSADIEVAQALDGLIRHIEYRSRAGMAYDWALEGAARCGIGWMRVVPRVVDPATNQQEICIDRVADHLSVMIDGELPDGSDAMNGFAETLFPKKRFKRLYPKASTKSWEGAGDGTWIVGDMVRVCEHQYVSEDAITMVAVKAPDNGEELHLTEAEFADLAARVGYVPEHRTYAAKSREVHWLTFNGDEILEETILPGQYIGMVPVIGYETWVDGKRYLCGVTRRLMQGQRAYNYERSALIEAVALQPKAPMAVAAESIEGHEQHFEALNTGQPAYLPYNALDGEGRPLPAPQRLAPPSFPAAFAQGGQVAVSDMEAAVGMYQANLGMPNNATSGRQERERKMQGDVATFHYADNQARSVEHLGRIIVGMIPAIYDTPRQAKILGIDGQPSSVEIDPTMEGAARKQGKKVVAINPTVGRYDVRVKTGPGFATQREEAAEGITAILQAAPQLTPILAPELARMRDWPNSEKISRALTAMAPPQVQALLGDEGEDPQIPPQVQAQMQAMQQEGAQMAQMLDQAQAEIQRLTAELQNKQADRDARLTEAQIDAEATERKALIDAEAKVREAEIRAQAEALALQMNARPEAEEPEESESESEGDSGALAAIVPALMSLQQQIATMAAPQQPMEIIHERDPATGLVVRSYERPALN